MAETESQKQKDELLKLVRDTRTEAQSLTSNARNLVKQGQFIQDLASHTEDFIGCVPSDVNVPGGSWQDQKAQWQTLRVGISEANKGLGGSGVVILADSTTVATTAVISDVIVASLPPSAQMPARQAYERFEQFLEQSTLLQDLRVEIDRLGLHHNLSGKESSLSLLQEAEDAFKIPSGSEGNCIAVLIPLRESINRAFADLLRRRPKQEKTGSAGDKVRSICNQSCRQDVGSAQIERLAREADDLNDVLSGAKQSVMTRTQVREAMNRGLVFFLAFLRMLDEAKFRKMV